MKKHVCSIAVAVAFTCTLLLCLFGMPVITAHAQDWNSSPSNWKNSPSNWENSSSNWKNGPNNWNNSQMKYGNDRIIRDNDGNALGYVVPKTDGGVNVFDSDGQRLGYLPSEE